jgi:hypothetical protein
MKMILAFIPGSSGHGGGMKKGLSVFGSSRTILISDLPEGENLAFCRATCKQNQQLRRFPGSAENIYPAGRGDKRQASPAREAGGSFSAGDGHVRGIFSRFFFSKKGGVLRLLFAGTWDNVSPD